MATGPSLKGRHRSERTGLLWWVVLTVVIGLAAFVRLYPNALVPGWDVDESAYTGIARNVANGEGVRLKPEYIDPGQAKLYTSHPPFGFYLEGGWFRLFGSGVTQARWLAVTASVVTVLLLVFFLRRLMEDKWGALLAGFLIAADGWMTFTNRVGWLENVQLVWGVLALWFYWRVSERVKRYEPLQHRSFFRRLTQRGWWVTYSWLFMAGLVLAAVLVWKQVGVYFLLAGMVHRAIVRPYRRRLPRPEGGVLRRQGMYLWRSMKATVRTVPRVLFGPLSLASALAVAAYIAYMTIWAGPEFFKSTLNQVKRALGLVESRGAVKSTGDIITPLVNQYSIYIGMLIVLAVAGLMVGWRVMRAVVGEDFWANLWVGNFRQLFRFERWYLNSPPADYALLFAWTLAAFMVFGGGKLWLPHYVFMIVLPAYCFLVSGLRRWQRDGIPGDKRAWVVGLVCVLLAGSGLFATYARMVKDPRNPVRDVVVWMDKNAELGSRVVTDEFIGQLIRQPYCKITHAQACEQRGGGRAPDYLILYTTTTQQLPRSAALQRMIDNSTEVYRTQGFKETIIIKRTKRGPPG